METMLETKGADYVTAWPNRVAAQCDCAVAYVIAALNYVTGSEVNEYVGRCDRLIPEVGALTPEQACDVVAAVKRNMENIKEFARTHCHYCGLDLDSRGQCTECV